MDCVVVYKVDRLSRSLLDFARIMGLFEKHGVSFVSVTQQFNTSTSLGRLTLNILLSFAQFEREIIGERTRDKMAAPQEGEVGRRKSAPGLQRGPARRPAGGKRGRSTAGARDLPPVPQDALYRGNVAPNRTAGSGRGRAGSPPTECAAEGHLSRRARSDVCSPTSFTRAGWLTKESAIAASRRRLSTAGSGRQFRRSSTSGCRSVAKNGTSMERC